MKHSMLLALLLALNIHFISAQETITAWNTPEGVFINWPHAPIPGDIWRLERLDDRSSNKKITTIECPKSAKQLHKRVDEAFEGFRNHLPLSDALIDTFWYKSKTKELEFDNERLPVIQIAFGNAWHDQTARFGTTYRYRLTCNGRVVAQSQPFIREKIVLADKVQIYRHKSNESNIELRACVTPANPHLASFKVMRSDLNKNQFVEVQGFRRMGLRNDSTILAFRDAGLGKFGFFSYYIIPYDWLGNAGTASSVYHADNLNQSTQPFVVDFDAKEARGNRSIKLSWHIGNLARVTGIHVYRSTYWDKDYQLIAELSSNDTVYTDQVNLANEAWYYYLGLDDVTGQTFNSHKTFAIPTRTEAPAPPHPIMAQTEGKGIRLSWQHTDPSVIGFQVFRATTGSEIPEFHPLTDFIHKDSSIFYSVWDTSIGLTGNQIYAYYVVARNDGFDFSSPSDTVYIRPNIPVYITPIQLREPVVTADNHQVMIVWENRADALPNLSGYRVYRKTGIGTAFDSTQYSLVDRTINTFTENDLLPNTSYFYMVRAEDMYGNISPMGLPVEVRINKPVVSVRRIYSEPTEQGVVLHWADLREEKDIKSFRIWRKDIEGRSTLLTELPATSSSYTDKGITPGDTYYYYVTVLTITGEESESSPIVLSR